MNTSCRGRSRFPPVRPIPATARSPRLAVVLACVIVWVVVYGADYYRLPPSGRVFHPKHPDLRPSGRIGLRLGISGLASFLCIYLYAARKRVKRMNKLGKTRNWLDFHIVLGIAAPIFITLHSSFKMNGIAGIAYWIMIAVMLSGIVGRYLYAQIPRSINAAELSMQEMQARPTPWPQSSRARS